MPRMPARDGTIELACHIWKFTMKRYVVFAWTLYYKSVFDAQGCRTIEKQVTAAWLHS